MDLHVVGPLASPAERAAVDGVLGPAESGWVGGVRRSGVDGHASGGGHALRARRSQLLPALHAVQNRVGWISQPALNYISRRLAVPPAEAYGVATFYALYATKPRPPVVAHVCDDIACLLAGAEQICDDLRRTVGPEGAAGRDGRAGWLRSPCLGLCDLAPAAMLTDTRATTQTTTAITAVMPKWMAERRLELPRRLRPWRWRLGRLTGDDADDPTGLQRGRYFSSSGRDSAMG